MYRPDGTSDNWIPKDVLEAEGYSLVPNTLVNHWRDLGITRREYHILLILLCSRRSRGTFPSLSTISERSGYSRRRVIESLRSLAGKGIIRVSRHARSRSNSYDLTPLWEKLSTCQSATDQSGDVASLGGVPTSLGGDATSPSMVTSRHPSNSLFSNPTSSNSSLAPKSIVKTKSLLKTMSIEPNGSRDVKNMSRDDFIKALKELGFNDDELGGNQNDS